MTEKFGPFKLAVCNQSNEDLIRNYTCVNYETCLGLAAALDWESFTCKNCCGEINSQLIWRAHHNIKIDRDLAGICNIPKLSDPCPPPTQAGLEISGKSSKQKLA